MLPGTECGAVERWRCRGGYARRCAAERHAAPRRQQGMYGADVRRVQEALIGAGFLPEGWPTARSAR